MNYYAIIPFLSFLANCVIGAYLLYKKFYNILSGVFFSFILINSVWSLFHVLVFTAPNAEAATAYNKVVIALTAFDATVFLHLVLNYLELKLPKKNINLNPLYVFIYVFPLATTILTFSTEFIISTNVAAYWGYRLQRRPAYTFHVFYVFLCYILGHFILFFVRQKIVKRANLLLISGYLILMGVTASIVFIRYLTQIELFPLAPELVTLGTIVIVFGMIRYDILKLTPNMAAEIIIDTVPDYLIVFREDRKISFMNQLALQDFLPPLTFLNEMPIDEIFTDKSHLGAIIEQIKNHNFCRDFEAEVHLAGERTVITSINGSTIKNKAGETTGYVLAIRNIAEQKRNLEQIQYLAYHDALTGLKNRKAFFEHIAKSLFGSPRHVSADVKVLFYIDLNNLKRVNDMTGHDGGDRYIKEVTRRVQNSIRDNDSFFRVGGDEFAVFLPGIARETDACFVAEKILNNISLPLSIKDCSFNPSACIGISLYPRDGEDMETLVKKADLAMYEAKKEGSGYRFYNAEMELQHKRRFEILDALHKALPSNQFTTHYQPIVDKDYAIRGAEVLIRWEHPDWGLVMPPAFIPIAEQARLINNIDEWVLKHTLEDIEVLRVSEAQDLQHINFFINFSGVYINEKNFIPRIKSIIKGYETTSMHLTIEATEDSLIKNEEYINQSFDFLTQSGIRLAIDDFGSKYSTFSYILKYPVTYIKIDRSFLEEILSNKRVRVLVEGILGFAGQLGIEVIAEGIENPEQHELLKSMGCNLMQGFLYSKPVPFNEFTKLLNVKWLVPEKGNVSL